MRTKWSLLIFKMRLWCSNSWHQRQQRRKKWAGNSCLSLNWPGWLQGVVKDFSVPMGIYRPDKRVSVWARVPIAAPGCGRGCVWPKTMRGVTQGSAIHLKVGRKKQERGDAREINLREIRLRTWLLNILYEKRAKKKSPQQWHSSAIKPLAQAREWGGECGGGIGGKEWEEGEWCAAEPGYSSSSSRDSG